MYSSFDFLLDFLIRIQLAASLIDSGKATAALEKCIAVSDE